jgi:hypothetical protein
MATEANDTFTTDLRAGVEKAAAARAAARAADDDGLTKQARYRQRQRDSGRHQVTLWVSEQEESAIRKKLDSMRKQSRNQTTAAS